MAAAQISESSYRVRKVPTAEAGFWSPDGHWLAHKSSRDAVIAIEVESGVAETLTVENAWPIIWGSDGAIYAWSSKGSVFRREFPLNHRLPSGPRTNRIVMRAPHGLVLFRPGPPASDVDLLDFQRLATPFLCRGPFAGGRLFLISTVENDTEGDALLDSSGTLLSRIPVAISGYGEVSWESISADGHWVVGQREHEVGEGHLAGSEVYVSDTTGSWRLKVDTQGNAMFPEFSPKGDLLVIEDPIKGGVRLGRLVIH